MNDPVAYRQYRIENAMYMFGLSASEATAQVDAEIADETALAEAYLRLVEALREVRTP